MNGPGERSGPTQAVPTLTEVVDLTAASPPAASTPTAPAAPIAEPAAAEPLAVLPSEHELVGRVLADVQRQVDLVLDYRLREVLTPILTRAADNIVRDARQQLAPTLRAVVAQAVAEELARHRDR